MSRPAAERVAATSTPPHALRERLPVSVRRRNGGGRNRLRPLADSCDIDGDQAEVRSGDGPDDRAPVTARSPVAAWKPSRAPTRATGRGDPDADP